MTTKKRQLISALMLAATAGGGYAANPIPMDTAIRYGKLPNGLTYYVRHNATPKGQADFFLAQAVGSVNEEENQRGLAHFLEHMCFNGTRHFPGNSLISWLESVGVKFGANLNAYTSTDETVYNICDVPVRRTSTVDSCLLILRDWSGDLTLDPKEIDDERGVVKGECRQRNSVATNRLLEKAAPVVYSQSIYGHRMPIGLMSVIDNFKPSELADYYHKWYHPRNQCVVVVGDIDPDAVVKNISELWKSFPEHAGQTVATLPEVAPNEGIIATVQRDEEQGAPMVQLWLKHDGVADDELNTIASLRRDMTAQLVTAMLVDRFDAREALPGIPYASIGIGDRRFLLSRGQQALMLSAKPFAGKETATVVVMAQELKRAAAKGFLDSELRRAKIDARAGVEEILAGCGDISNTSYAREYVDHFLNGGPLPSKTAWCKMMRGVISGISLDDVNAYIREVVSDNGDNTVMLAYMPESDDNVTATGLREAYDGVYGMMLADYHDAVSDNPLLAELPTPGHIVSESADPKFGSATITLSNGIKVRYRYNDKKKDQVLVRGCSPGGFSVNYNPADAALYQLADDVLAVSAYGPFTGTQLRKRLAGKNARASLSIDKVEEKVEASTTRNDLETAFQLLYLKLTAPRKDSVAFRNLLAAKRDRILSQSANPTFAMADSIHAYVFQRHPFEAKISEKMIDDINYDRVLALHRDRFGDMSDFIFYVTGDFDTDSLRTYACRYLAALPAAGRKEKGLDTGFGYAQGREKRSFSMPMKEPQSICYTFYNSPSEYNLQNVVTGHIAGEVLHGRLLADLRENRGWTYGIQSHVGISAGYNGGKEASVIMPVYIRVQPENADSTFEVVARTVEDMADPANISADEIAKAVGYMEKNHAAVDDDNAYWLTVLRMYDRFGKDMHSGYLDIVKRVRPRDVAEFVRKKLLKGNRLQLEMKPSED